MHLVSEWINPSDILDVPHEIRIMNGCGGPLTV
jgi:hypothetical protein